MRIDQFLKDKYIASNQREYSFCRDISFIKENEINKYEKLRNELLKDLSQLSVKTGCNVMKMDIRELSPGCKICTEGYWSCLFINNVCNAHCFYCPAEQKNEDVPQTNRLQFSQAKDYAEYVDYFGFKGVSFSGGEPLMTYNKTLNFLKEVKKRSGNNVHCWLYTNGILLTKDMVSEFKDSGLDEIRFDIGATGYDLTKAKMAIDEIPVITVEIPAVPEDYDKLKQLLPVMNTMGIDYLNIHQLRCTPYNAKHLLKRGYTFLHGPKVTVLASELTALKLIRAAKQHHLELPVNYCSFIYKSSYQAMAERKRTARCFLQPGEELTETGYIRKIRFFPMEKSYEKEYPAIFNHNPEHYSNRSVFFFFTELNKFSNL